MRMEIKIILIIIILSIICLYVPPINDLNYRRCHSISFIYKYYLCHTNLLILLSLVPASSNYLYYPWCLRFHLSNIYIIPDACRFHLSIIYIIPGACRFHLSIIYIYYPWCALGSTYLLSTYIIPGVP